MPLQHVLFRSEAIVHNKVSCFGKELSDFSPFRAYLFWLWYIFSEKNHLDTVLRAEKSCNKKKLYFEVVRYETLACTSRKSPCGNNRSP
jgi:hypothetical protein